MSDDFVTLAHGNGGQLTHELVNRIFLKRFDNPILSRMEDSAILPQGEGRQVFTTDSFIVSPLFFPGGDIGKLSIAGTINDLAVMGATPMYLSCGIIIEEGFPLKDLEKIAESLLNTANDASVKIVTGDTKVVPKGKIDGLFINTSGIGILERTNMNLSTAAIKPGDKVIINGTIGDHGMAILAAREDFPIQTDLKSDCAPLNDLIEKTLNTLDPKDVKIIRDPTRGGIGTTLNEFTMNRDFGIELDETALPIREDVKTLSEMTGFDPLYIANEGKALMVVTEGVCEKALAAMRRHPMGKNAAVIGTVTKKNSGRVILKSEIGGRRIVDMLVGDMLPRIC